MSLISQITAKWNTWFPSRGLTTSDEVGDIKRVGDLARRFSGATSRGEVIRVCRDMYDRDPIAKGLLARLASDVVKGGFTVEVTGGRNALKAQAAADDLLDRLDAAQQLDDWIRLSGRDGDSFLEPSIEKDTLHIVQVTRKPTLEMHRDTNRRDQFKDRARAFWQADIAWGAEPPSDALWFAEWQIIHARWNHDAGQRYGLPEYASATGPWKRAQDGEINIAIRRLVRAGQKMYHYIKGGISEINAYKAANRPALNNPFEAAVDYYGNSPEGPKMVQGDANLDQIGDVKHHINTWTTAAKTPLFIIGYGGDLNRDVLEDLQARYYEESVPAVARWSVSQIIKPILELQWLLLGIWPDALEYKVVWDRERKTQAQHDKETAEAVTGKAEAIRNIGEAGIKIKATGLPPEVVAGIVARLLAEIDPEIDPEEVVNQIKAGQPDEIGRMADLVNDPNAGTANGTNGTGGTNGNGNGATREALETARRLRQKVLNSL